jgi:hypothetical protein
MGPDSQWPSPTVIARNAIALRTAVTFMACVVYGLVVPRAFHASPLLEQILPGFRWLTPGSVLLGVGETFVYGAYADLVFTLIHNTVLRRSQ